MDVVSDNDHKPDMPGLAPIENLRSWFSVPKVAKIFLAAGMPRNKRTIRRYCERGELDCRKTENDLHQPQYFIDPKSVETYIAQQRTLMQGSPEMSGQSRTEPDTSGHDRTFEATIFQPAENEDMSGQSRTHPGMSGQSSQKVNIAVTEQLLERLKEKDGEIAFLRGELLHRRTTDTALHDVIAAFRANAETQRIAAASPVEKPDIHPHGI